MNLFSLFLGKYVGIKLLSHRLKCMFTIIRNCQTVLQRVEPFDIHTINISLSASQRKIWYKTKLWWHLSEEYFITVPRVGKIAVGIVWREEKTASRGEWIGTCQLVFIRKPARGDRVGSGFHSYQSRLCSQLMTFIPHARPSVHDPSNLGNLLFLLKLCFIEILFGVSLSVTSSLSCLTAKIGKLRTARLFEFVLLISPPVVVSKSG